MNFTSFHLKFIKFELRNYGAATPNYFTIVCVCVCLKGPHG